MRRPGPLPVQVRAEVPKIDLDECFANKFAQLSPQLLHPTSSTPLHHALHRQGCKESLSKARFQPRSSGVVRTTGSCRTRRCQGVHERHQRRFPSPVSDAGSRAAAASTRKTFAGLRVPSEATPPRKGKGRGDQDRHPPRKKQTELCSPRSSPCPSPISRFTESAKTWRGFPGRCDAPVLPHAHARVRCAEVDADSGHGGDAGCSHCSSVASSRCIRLAFELIFTSLY